MFPMPPKQEEQRLRVETNATIFPSSLIVASRLSSATTGDLVVDPAIGAMLAGVSVMRLKVPVVKS